MVDALISIALEKLTGYVGQQLSLFADAPRELEKLSSTLKSIQVGLADAERRQVGDQNVKLWLSRLRHVAYDIEDLVEDWQISSLGDQEGNEDDGNSRKKARLLFGSVYRLWNDATYRLKVGHDIKEIRKRLEDIDVEGKRYSFSSSTQGGDYRRPVGSQRLTTSLMDETERFIGRENDKETIIGKLVSASSHEDQGRAQIVAVVGIGGVGKTTLARQVYHDDRVQDHFNTALYWVCVSDVFDEIRLTKAILEQVEQKGTSLLELDALQRKLLEALRRKRFLLVLDDVWNDDAEKWKMLRLSLNSGAQGSKILVTTRVQKVADTMNATYVHKLQGLSDDDSWKVFTSRAFVERTPEECSTLENVGRQIVSKCGGLPLAITVMGSAMSSKRTTADWQNILDSKMWSLRDAENKILPALWLSYYNLPSQLKQCFAYCSMFPKDWEMEKDILVTLWAAQGFILSDGNRDIEDIGADYFDDLVAWSMFQEVKTKWDGKITCKIHNLLHDLAESLAKDEIYTFIRKSEQCPIASSNVRHSFLTFYGSAYGEFNKIQISLGKATKLRTLFLDCHGGMDKFIVDILRQARFVRALVFRGLFFSGLMVKPCNAIVELLKAIVDLKHLRYLNLSRLGIVELPESVCDLYYLHALNLNNCRKLEKLPRGIGRMVSLRHLEIEGTDKLKYLPKGLGRISGLRSLCKFIVGGGDEGEGCGMDDLQPLNSLQGTLRIVHLERVSSRKEAEKAELWKKQHLGSLVLNKSGERDYDYPDAETGTIDSVLEGLRPHENLEELELCQFIGSKLPSWMNRMRRLQKLQLWYGPQLERVPHLRNLKEFQIWGLRNEILPDEGWERLMALQILSISYCNELKCLPEGLTLLPSLENLSITGCGRLESLLEGLGQLQKLKSLEVGDSKVMRRLPDSLGQLKKLKTLTVSGFQVLRCLPDSVGQLESLEHLNIKFLYKLVSLPASLGQLKKLKSLDVSFLDVLTRLPDSLGQLEPLQALRIHECRKLESLPASLGQLKKLEKLDVSFSNVLTRLPDSLGQLESLQALLIHKCRKLESLPASLGQLKKLKNLYVCGSEVLTRLPDSVGQLESLESLYICFCRKLESLPASLGQLKKLKSLNVGYSDVLTRLPDSVGQLESLEYLNIEFLGKLESLPASLGQLKKLKKLSVCGSEALTRLPDSVGQLESLQELRIRLYEKLESLPVSLGQLKKLKKLYVCGSEVLTRLPDSVGQLESLQKLEISECEKLKSLPDSVGQLELLESLNISYCEKLECLPEGLHHLPHLQKLKINRCPLLWERYKRERGVDWPSISHIPNIVINGPGCSDDESSDEF